MNRESLYLNTISAPWNIHAEAVIAQPIVRRSSTLCTDCAEEQEYSKVVLVVLFRTVFLRSRVACPDTRVYATHVLTKFACTLQHGPTSAPHLLRGL